MKILSFFLLMILILCAINVEAQNSQSPKSVAPILLTADSLASGNYKDVLTSFYQLAVKNLTGPNKELHFASNPFAIMLRKDPNLAINENYKKSINKFWRRINFDLDAKLDSAYHFNGFAVGLNYAIINERDITISRAFAKLAKNNPNDTQYARVLHLTDSIIKATYNGTIRHTDTLIKLLQPSYNTVQHSIDSLRHLSDSLHTLNSICNLVSALHLTSSGCRLMHLAQQSSKLTHVSDSLTHISDHLIHQKDSLQNVRNLLDSTREALLEQEDSAAMDSTFTFDKLDPQLQKLIRQIAVDNNLTYVLKALADNPNLNICSERNKGFNELVKSFQKKPLWTIGTSDTSYSNGRLFKSVQIYSEFLKGIIHPTNIANLELDIKAYTNFTDDTLKTGKNLNRLVFNFEPGVNLVLKGKKTQQSYAEFKVSGSYINVWKGSLYANENRITNTINGTLRIRVFDEVWIPIEVKYDTKNHNVFGFLNVTTNFKALGNAFKNKN